MFISYIKLGSSNLPPGNITFHRGKYLEVRPFAYLEKLVNSPNLNFGAERLVGSSTTVSILFIAQGICLYENLPPAIS